LPREGEGQDGGVMKGKIPNQRQLVLNQTATTTLLEYRFGNMGG
jgi:hypothetical protein